MNLPAQKARIEGGLSEAFHALAILRAYGSHGQKAVTNEKSFLSMMQD